MLYAIFLKDRPDVDPDIRPRLMGDHLAFLSKMSCQIHAAGPLKEQDGSIRGGMWLVDVETVDQAWALVKADPFWPTGLRDKVEIKQWSQVFASGKSLI